ncbi:MAG: DNA cytosine methyltransferase [Bradyrhizobiaceae bacterium]|nr:DNA cytosine methyltransferase [Bradyrhizobiaceae bacterium]
MSHSTNISTTSVAAVDLFCGAGGLTHGLERAGISVRAGVDLDPACRYPYEENNKADFWEKSVVDVTADEIRAAWGKAKYRVLAGCAPCQPFSTYMQGKVDSSDARWNLLDEFARLVRDCDPHIVTMENVPRLEEQDVFEKFKASLRASGFEEVTTRVVNCAEYGIPQKRRRLVLLASKFGKLELLPPKSTKQKTVMDVIGDLPRLVAGQIDPKDILHQSCSLSPTNMDRIKNSKPGGSWRDWSEDLRTNCHKKESGKNYASVYGRMRWEEPSPTITTQFFGFGNGRFGHPEQDRALSFREGAILQSFPKDYKFVRKGAVLNKTAIGRLIGNAVPVKLGEVIGKSILGHLQQIQSS